MQHSKKNNKNPFQYEIENFSDKADIKKYLGDSIRFIRMKVGLSAKELAERLGVSPSTICKIEKNKANPSLDLLRNITTELSITIKDLFHLAQQDNGQKTELKDVDRTGSISLVKADERKILHLTESEIEFQILSPDLQGSFEFVYIELEKGQGGSKSFRHRSGEESMLILSGTLTIHIEDKIYTLDAGDCITFDARLLHNYRNEGTQKVKCVYVVVPPAL